MEDDREGWREGGLLVGLVNAAIMNYAMSETCSPG